MCDCKLISIRINICLTSRQVYETVTGRQTVTVYDNPVFEEALNRYLKQRYRIVDMYHFDGAFYSVLLEREI